LKAIKQTRDGIVLGGTSYQKGGRWEGTVAWELWRGGCYNFKEKLGTSKGGGKEFLKKMPCAGSKRPGKQ